MTRNTLRVYTSRRTLWGGDWGVNYRAVSANDDDFVKLKIVNCFFTHEALNSSYELV